MKRSNKYILLSVFLLLAFLVIILALRLHPLKGNRTPPGYDNSLLYWQENLSCLELFCGGKRFGSEAYYYRVPEIWRFREEKWEKVCELDEIGSEATKVAFDSHGSRLLILSLARGLTWVWDGNVLTKTSLFPHKLDYAELIYNSRNRSVELLDYRERKIWLLDGTEWKELKGSVIPRVIPSQLAFEEDKNRRLAFGTLEPLSATRHLGLVEIRDGTWRELRNLQKIETSSFMAASFSVDASRGTVLVFASNMDMYRTFQIFEVDEADLIPIPSDDAPSFRFNATVAYDPSRDRLVLYGGSGKYISMLHALLLDDYYHETWAITYSNEKEGYIWKRID